MDYPQHYRRLKEQLEGLGRELPGPMGAFSELHAAASAAGALDVKTKELIALAIAVTVRCDGCIAYHVHDALAAGAARGEVLEAVGVAVLMGGGPSVVYGAQAREALDQFQRAGAAAAGAASRP